MAEPFNYHVNLWPEGGSPSTYLCLICSFTNATHAEIVSHLSAAHEVTPVPTPLAASMPSLLTLGIHFTQEPDHAPSPNVPHGN